MLHTKNKMNSNKLYSIILFKKYHAKRGKDGENGNEVCKVKSLKSKVTDDERFITNKTPPKSGVL